MSATTQKAINDAAYTCDRCHQNYATRTNGRDGLCPKCAKTKTEHTPGPWEVVATTAKGAGSQRKDIVTVSGEWNPAFVAGDILEVDARLIAAAPEMLAALEACKEYIAVFHNAANPRANTVEVYAKARAAIAKAKGAA